MLKFYVYIFSMNILLEVINGLFVLVFIVFVILVFFEGWGI